MRNKILLLLVAVLIIGCNRASKEELYAKGLEALKNGDSAAAIVMLKSALEMDQDLVDARYQLALAYLAASKYEDAEWELKKVQRQKPEKSEVLLTLARVYNQSNRGDEALKEIDAYLAEKPGDAEALGIKGATYAVLKDFPQAEKFLREAMRVNPQSSSSKLALAQLYATTNRETGARTIINEVIAGDPKNLSALFLLAQLEKFNGNSEKALEIYQNITKADSSNVHAHYQMGIIYLAKNDSAKVEQIAADLTTRFPKRGEGIRLTGMAQYMKKDYIRAISSLQNAVKLQPTIDSYYYLGLAQYAAGDLEVSLSQFRSILNRHPAHTSSRMMIATILQQQKKYDESITETQKIIAAQPKNAVAHNILGNAYLSKGQFDEGLRELNRATELDPKFIDAHLKKGFLHISRGKEREGEAEFLAAIQGNPEILNPRMTLFAYYQKQGNHAKALEIIKQGLTGKKEDAALYNAMASVMVNQKKPEEALSYLHKAISVNPDYLPSYFNLARFYASKSEYDKAVFEFKRILGKEPQNIKALLGLAALYELKGQDKEALETYTKAKETKNDAAFLALAGYYSRKKQNGKAIDVLTEALKVSVKNIKAMELKGRLLVDAKKYDEALKLFDDIEQINQGVGIEFKIKTFLATKDILKAQDQAQRMITLKPNSALGYLYLSSICESEKDLNGAIHEVKRGLKAEPANLDAKMKLSLLYLQKMDYASASGILNEVIKSNANFAPAHAALGSILIMTGKKKEAVKKYRDALDTAENYLPALNNLAYLYADGYGNKEEALRLATKAYDLSPGTPEIMDTLGYALIVNGKLDESLKVLEKVIAAQPGNQTALYHYALALNGKGDYARATENVNKALQKGAFPEATEARKLQGELAKGAGRK